LQSWRPSRMMASSVDTETLPQTGSESEEYQQVPFAASSSWTYGAAEQSWLYLPTLQAVPMAPFACPQAVKMQDVQIGPPLPDDAYRPCAHSQAHENASGSFEAFEKQSTITTIVDRSPLRTATGKRKGKKQREAMKSQSMHQDSETVSNAHEGQLVHQPPQCLSKDEQVQTFMHGDHIDKLFLQNEATLHFLKYFVFLAFMVIFVLLGAMWHLIRNQGKLEICKRDLTSCQEKYAHGISLTMDRVGMLTRDLTMKEAELYAAKQNVTSMDAELTEVKDTFNKMSHRNAELAWNLTNKDAALEEAQDIIAVVTARTSELEHDVASKNAQQDGIVFANDKLRATLSLAKQELSRRAQVADLEAKKRRMAKRHNIQTLFHGLHWMWKSDQTQAKLSKSYHIIRRLKALLKDLQAEQLVQSDTIKELRSEDLLNKDMIKQYKKKVEQLMKDLESGQPPRTDWMGVVLGIMGAAIKGGMKSQ